MIFHSKPSIGKEEIQAVQKVLESGWVVEGKEVQKFEDSVCKYLGWKSGYAVALSSGTAALYVTLISLGIKNGDEVIIPTYVCSAVLNAVNLTGAKPILVDSNPDDFNISFERTKENINTRTKAIIIPHTFGMPADVDRFVKLNIPIIEDCAQSIGSKLHGKHLGVFGKAAIFSFYASKMLTTGYGGMIFSKDRRFIEKVRDYREFDCRKTYKPRFNFQMSDFQAALGSVQLKKLSLFLKKRKSIAREYYKAFPSNIVWPQSKVKQKETNFFRFLIRVKNPNKIKKILEKKGVQTIIPIQTHELLHRYLSKSPSSFPVAEEIAKTTLSLPIYPTLTSVEVKHIISSVKSILSL